MSTAFHMIDVGHKAVTRRVAVAQGTITVGPQAFPLIKNRSLPKGDALVLSEIAGIQGAKRASDLIPLCHPMPLDHVQVTSELNETSQSVKIYCLAATHAKTGVEMEAMAGVAAALLTIYDLTKMIEPALTISEQRLLIKTGGKSGTWICPQGIPDWLRKDLGVEKPRSLEGIRAATLVLSDRASAGIYEDKAGTLLNDELVNAGAQIISTAIVPDDKDTIVNLLKSLVSEKKPQLIILTGGTGIAPRDVTPEAIKQLMKYDIPGIGELLRQNGSQFTRHSWSSRSLASIIGETLVIALPGSPKAVKEGMDCLLPLLPHLILTLAGQKHDLLSTGS